MQVFLIMGKVADLKHFSDLGYEVKIVIAFAFLLIKWRF